MFKTGGTKFGAFGDSNTTSANSTAKTSNTTKEVNVKSSSSKFEPADFAPKRFGLKYDPPSIILEYLIPSSGKLYHHKIKMPQLKSDSDTMETLEVVKKKHHSYFVDNKVSESQIKTLIDKLKSKLKPSSSTGTFVTGNDFSDAKKDSKGFGSLSSKPAATTSFGNKGFGSTVQSTKTAVPEKKAATPEKKAADKKSSGGNNFWDFEDIEDLEDDVDVGVDYNTTNLNKLTKEELDKHKEKMNNVFSKNQKKPGEAGYIYDKQEEFAPSQDNDWDEDF